MDLMNLPIVNNYVEIRLLYISLLLGLAIGLKMNNDRESFFHSKTGIK